MPLKVLLQPLADFVRPLSQALLAGERLPALELRRPARLPVLAALHAALSESRALPLVYLTDRADHALAIAEELAQWGPQTLRLPFPEPTPLFYENAAWGDSTRRERLMALTALAVYHIPGALLPPAPPLIIAPARALMTRSLPRRDFLKATRILRTEQTIQIGELSRACVALGYEPSNTVIAPGQFARRGGLIDLWPPAEPHPVRLEFFGDEIDSLRRFDPATQRTVKPGAGLPEQTSVLVTPAREYITPTQSGEANEFSEFWIPSLHPAPSSLLDYLPRQALVCIDDLQALEDAVHEVEAQAVSMRKDFIQEGVLPADFPIPYLTWDEIRDALSVRPTLELGPPSIHEPGAGALELPGSAPGAAFTAGPRFAGRLKPFLEHLLERGEQGEPLVIVSRQAARLSELWREQQAVQPAPAAAAAPQFLEGSLAEGWIFTSPSGQALHLLTDGEIFGWRRPEVRRRARPSMEAPEASYSDLQTGDYVVHVDHGIGRYAGLVQRTVEGVEREYLCLDYADEAQLFVPVHQADRLTRYVGPGSDAPPLSRLGSQEWRSVKSHVKEAVVEVAEDLLDLYARRSVVDGYQFSPDQHWQQELEASFPYIETDDQMRVLAEVKHDMESPRPMDRLICGDVGYGKTEVALRAAFKAVLDGRQVAILVPTTVLAQQHFNTFQQRLAAFPVQVEMLSRFRNPQQQRQILERLGQGGVDILIGTHRMLSADVQFKDLGLLIIDEEQRFGVTHKETLKKMRTEVDVLTLTATPIPRTLYMALSGVRDISTINTPPEERLPIVTHVGPYSPKLARQAILREMERGGQVFFVHNRVQTINAMHSHLNALVPEARIAVAHGQMPEGELSERMEQFSAGDVDLLLSTSIIESGLDIPNANTLIIDRADTFGLAQLYQLRGRVGRGAQRAYAYFFRHNRLAPTPEGRQRLETIAENTQLGAGFSIAMRDLEIRGTGDILGTRQHGHIAAVGFHLYTALLAEAVRRMRRQRGLPVTAQPLALAAPAAAANVELPLPVSIPAAYVPDKNVRLGLYRRLADMRSLPELDTLAEEFKDRFGPPPESVQNLFYQLKVKILAEKAGLNSVTVESGQIALRFPEGVAPPEMTDLPGVRAGKVALWMAYSGVEDWQERLAALLTRL
jgi:transcription-repair coupling factor (superfamily II helicase)